MSAGETALRASSVSTAMDDVTASSSSTPSTEGLQDHIESLLQRLPDMIPLSQKSSPNSVVGVSEPILPYDRRFAAANAFAHTPPDYKTWNLGRSCSGWWSVQFYNLYRIVLAALSTCACHAGCVACTGLKTIGPLYYRTGSRFSRLTGLMMSDDLGSADLLDTLSQGAAVEAAET